MRLIFISYSSKDRSLVEALVDDLELMFDDVVVWYDRELNRSGGHLWWNLILEQIRRCDVFLYALSPHVLASEPCRREYGYARALGKPVLPLLMADLDIRYLPVELQAAQLVNFRERNREQQKSLKASLRNLPSAYELPEPLPTPPDAPLDPVGVLFDRIARLSHEADVQRLLMVHIEDLDEEEAFRKHVPELLARLIARDDILTARNLRRAQELQARIGSPTPPPHPPSPPAETPAVSAAPPPVVSKPAPAPPPPASPVQAAIARARTFNGKRNTDWQPFVATFSDLKIPEIPFCLVPTGTFQMGNDIENNWTRIHSQTMDKPYWIAQTPVTNAQWAQAVRAQAVPEPENDDSLKWYHDPAMADAPVVGVTWFMARDFAAWLGARLPTEREWEFAARGVENFLYPWGNQWDGDRVVWEKDSGGKPALVQSRPEGSSWVGALHLSGNVWEWTASLYETYPYLADGTRERDTGTSTDVMRVLRGGSWVNTSTDGFLAACRVWVYPPFGGYIRGFRLARSL